MRQYDASIVLTVVYVFYNATINSLIAVRAEDSCKKLSDGYFYGDDLDHR